MHFLKELNNDNRRNKNILQTDFYLLSHRIYNVGRASAEFSGSASKQGRESLTCIKAPQNTRSSFTNSHPDSSYHPPELS